MQRSRNLLPVSLTAMRKIIHGFAPTYASALHPLPGKPPKGLSQGYLPCTSITTYSDLQPVLNRMAQSEMPEVTMKSVPPRLSRP